MANAPRKIKTFSFLLPFLPLFFFPFSLLPLSFLVLGPHLAMHTPGPMLRDLLW